MPRRWDIPSECMCLSYFQNNHAAIVAILTEDLPIVKSTLSQHLKELKDAGLIQGEIEAPRVKYCLNKENWKEAQDLFRKFLKMDIEEPIQKCQ